MTTATDRARTALVSPRAHFLWHFRLIPRIETYPRVLLFAQTIAGKLAILALFGIGAYYLLPHWKPLILCLAVITALPQYRRILLTVSTLLWACGIWWRWTDHPRLVEAAILFTLAALLFWLAILLPNSWFGRRPVATLLIGFALSVFLASHLPRGGSLRAVSWDFLTVAGAYLWFIAYSLLDISSKSRDPFTLQVGTYHPFWDWASTYLPFAKGAAYLRRIGAQNAEQLAVAQLKGLKLLLWSVILDVLLKKAFRPVVYGYMGIPLYADLFELSVHRVAFPWYLGWASLVANFLESMMGFSIWGHRAIASCRMAGFLALRNTYRPLASRSIAEFWNRYNYYFKELMVDCFFYPTFMRCFKKRGRWRLFVATFVAAGFGTSFYAFFSGLNYIEELGFWRALEGFKAYIFYTIVLALGIGISQVRDRTFANSGWIRGRLIPALSVTGFYCVLSIFDHYLKRYPIEECFRFLAHLFNLVT
jgi:hypothetical protein